MKYAFKTKPYDHQRDALKKLLHQPKGGGLFMEMGTGKTKVAIDYACIRKLKNEIDQVLVVAPLSTLGVWDAEIQKHSTQEMRWKIINYDKARMDPYLKELLNYMREGR